MQQRNLFDFPTCQAISNSLTNVTIPSAGFAAKLNMLCKEFERCFSHFNKWQFSFQLFSNHDVDVNTAPEDIQMELIELHHNDTLRAKFNSIGIAEFYPLLPVTVPQTHLHAAQVLLMLGCTYLCEQLSSLIKLNKSPPNITTE
ncbi:GT2D2 protein, partial [Amia calva]|nr:GT2D2 protein [Amia calva]